MGRPFHHLVDVRVPLEEQALFDVFPLLGVQPPQVQDGIHEEAISLVRWDPPGRGVRLNEKAQLFQVGHDVADRRRAEPHLVFLGDNP